MKNTFTLLLLIVVSADVTSQGVFTNQTNGALAKVIQDYPNQFKNIKGDLLLSNHQMEEYRSTIAIPGAASSTITQYYSSGRHNISWEATLYSTATFDDASTKFKELFGQIKNTIIKIDGERPIILNGKFETPEAEKRLTTASFDIIPATRSTQKIKVDLSLEKVNQYWKIVLSVHDNDRKEEEAMVSNSQ